MRFDDIYFNLKWSDKPNKNYFIQEYLPEGEELENFNQMLTLHIFDTKLSLKDVVEKKLQELMARKQTDALCNYQINESPDGKEFIVDFLLSSVENNKMKIVEFNVYRYKQVSLSSGTQGILCYAYTKRAYAENIGSFLNKLGSSRTSYLNKMIGTTVPEIKVGK